MTDLEKMHILSVLPFIIPLNIYVIGDYLGAGIQFSLVRYQYTYIGESLITLLRDINYIILGSFTGRTILSVFVWVIGVIFCVIAFFIIWVLWQQKQELITYAGILVILSAFFYLLSIMIQYGFLFSGPGGFAIPIGIPLLVVIGIWIYFLGLNFLHPNTRNP